MRQVLTGRVESRRRWAWLAGVVVLLGALWGLAAGSRDARGAEGDGCTPNCVILIQVDGLEPKDVTEQTTPYLWRLAHPQAQNQNVPTPALSQRAGWMWQAPRGVVSSGTAPATASLLTGSFPESSGVPADDFYGPTTATGPLTRQRLTAGGFGDAPNAESGPDVAQPIGEPAVDTLIGIAGGMSGAAVFLGDPGLASVTNAATQGRPYWFPPGTEGSATTPEGQFTGDPRLCPLPRYPDGGAQLPGQQPAAENFNPSYCPANDLTTMNKAVSDLKQRAYSSVGFTFIHLAELGAAKRLADIPDVPSADNPQVKPPQPAEALSDTDQAVATFVEQYAQNTPASKWQKTVLMVVGSHGYQTTPLSNRVPDPNSPTPTADVSDYITQLPGFAGALTLVPQGTMATVYFGVRGRGDPADRRHALDVAKRALETDVDAACQRLRPDLGSCIRGVYFTDRNTPDTEDTLARQRATWRLDARNPDTGARTGASGDLVVELNPGWAFGRAAGLPYQGGVQGQPVTNPSTASAGGPRERAVAALINGSNQSSVAGAVRNLDSLGSAPTGLSQTKYYPVSKGAVDPREGSNPSPVTDPACPDTATDPGGVACANDPANVGNDAADPGHELQPVTVDFALTISALMQLPFEAHPDQLQGRVLQEAFLAPLAKPCVGEACEPPPPPTCTDVAALTLTNQPVAVSFSCADLTDAPLSYNVMSGPSHGTLGPIEGDKVTYTPDSGFSGNDTFTYRATSKNGTADVATATISVAEPPVFIQPKGFDFDGLVRKLKAVVVDSNNKPYAQARRGAVLSTIRLEADFGKPEAAVTLTFYRRITGAVGSVVRLKAIARFDPFVVKRGHVTMRLKVPPQFKPNYVGLTVRELALIGNGRRRLVGGLPCTTLRTIKPVPFRCTGPSSSKILPIADANRLHKPKGGAVPRRRR